MTTKELEEKLKISKNTCIHCPTEELAEQVLGIFNQLGLKWSQGTPYIRCANWDNYKGNTVYYPFEGEFSSLNYARLIDYKAINAEEFIALHTKRKEFDLKSYTPKGELEGFPKEIIARMLDYQEEQGNPRDVSVFERDRREGKYVGGFEWNETKEGNHFWHKVINKKDFNLFFEKYPKQDNQDNPQEFRGGDEVIDIITRQRGKVFKINTNGDSNLPMYDDDILPVYVSFNKGEQVYTLDGRYFISDEYPRLLHYREDYNYDVIDFNNLPKRQEPTKRWRAEKEGVYYFVNFYTKDWFFSDETQDNNNSIDDINYNSGNYFRTEIEAKNIAQKLNTYFKQLIQEEHEHEGK